MSLVSAMPQFDALRIVSTMAGQWSIAVNHEAIAVAPSRGVW